MNKKIQGDFQICISVPLRIYGSPQEKYYPYGNIISP